MFQEAGRRSKLSPNKMARGGWDPSLYAWVCLLLRVISRIFSVRCCSLHKSSRIPNTPALKETAMSTLGCPPNPLRPSLGTAASAALWKIPSLRMEWKRMETSHKMVVSASKYITLFTLGRMEGRARRAKFG